MYIWKELCPELPSLSISNSHLNTSAAASDLTAAALVALNNGYTHARAIAAEIAVELFKLISKSF